MPKYIHERIVGAVNFYEMGLISSDELRGEVEDILNTIPEMVSRNEWETLVFSAIPASVKAVIRSNDRPKNNPNMVRTALESGIFGPKSIEIYGGAYHAMLALEAGMKITDMGFLAYITSAVDFSRCSGENTKGSKVARNFCELIMVDPRLIETAIGQSLSEWLDK